MARNVRVEALKENVNTVGMAACVGLSLALLNPIPLMVGVAAEAAYMLFIPDTAWYRSRVAQREREDRRRAQEAKRAEIVAGLLPYVRKQYDALVVLRKDIELAMEGDATYYGGVVDNLDTLQDNFLMFASKEKLFSNYLHRLLEEALEADGWRQTNEARGQYSRNKGRGEDLYPFRGYLSENYEAQIDWVREAVRRVLDQFERERQALLQRAESPEETPDTKAVLLKRAEVLEKRQEHVQKMGHILTNLRSQLALVQDTFGLLNDQIRARTPQQVLSEIESVVTQTDSTTRLLEDMAPLEQMVARLG